MVDEMNVAITGAIEADSQHPLASAIVEKQKHRDETLMMYRLKVSIYYR